MLNDILSILWVFLPVAYANMAPVIANNIQFFKKFSQPLDFSHTFRGKRIFGDHKTVRGLLAGVVLGTIVVGVQMVIATNYSWFEQYSLSIDYSSAVTLLMGAIMGFGALAGDAIKSFFKRQIDIAPGKNWIPFDQLDFVTGGLLASTIFFVLPLRLYILGLLIALVLHPTANVLAWLLRMQDRPF